MDNDQKIEAFDHNRLKRPDARKADVHHAILRAGANIPRYMFRAWDDKPGGDETLNTVTSITPAANFVHREKAPETIFDVDH